MAANGFASGYAWMKFVRDAHPPRFAAPEVEVVEVADAEQEPFGMIAATGFGLPAWASAFFATSPRTPAGAATSPGSRAPRRPAPRCRIHEGIAEFGIAATLEPARGRGCQLALLHRRILDAAAAGCHTLFVETGERSPQAAPPPATATSSAPASRRPTYARTGSGPREGCAG